MKLNNISGKNGFTLIEIVVAIGVLSLFIGIIYATFFGTIRAIRTSEIPADSFPTARVILDKIARDLKGAVHVMNDPRYVFNGIDAYDGDPSRDRIDFISVSNIINDSTIPQSDLAEISYYIDPNYTREGYLVRRIDLYPDKEPDKGGELKIVAEGITGLNFKYFYIEPKTDEAALTEFEKQEEKKTAWELLEDADNWQDKWDWKERNFIPILVKIELSLMEKTGDETTFSTVVYLNRDPRTVNTATQTTRSGTGDTSGETSETDRRKGGTERDGRNDDGPDGRRERGKNRDNKGTDRPPISQPVLEQGNIRKKQ